MLLLALAHPALLLLALAPAVPGFTAMILLVHLTENWALKRSPRILAALDKVQLNATHRQLIRDGALLALAARTEVYEFPVLAALTMGVLALHGLHGGLLVLRAYVTKLRALPAHTRNIDLSDLRIPDAPTPILRYGGPRRPPHLLIPVFTGMLLDLTLGQSAFGLVGLIIGLTAGAAAGSVLLAHAARSGHLSDRAGGLQQIQQKLAAYQPEVALYYSSGQNTAYQVNMWLSTLADLKRRSVIIVREKVHLSQIAPTSIPILCLTSGSDVMNFDLPDLKVVLYVGNVGNNIHMLRNRNVKHVFIGHGDSDKAASANPFSKVYDEIWVAGPAGRNRYRRARVGVRDEAVVEVGRPQLAAVEPLGSRVNPLFTVLYAPTFEGWSTDMELSSINILGRQLIRRLLAHAPEIRVLYRPHPLTGVRDAAVRRAHRAIVAALDAANKERLRQPHSAVASARTHRTIIGPHPDLYSCFNQADLLISDVSSVASDFLASRKPYVITNLQDIDEGIFRARHTAAGGAYLLSPDCRQLPGILAAVQSSGVDALADAREQTRRYLLGADQPDAMTRFNEAVEALIKKQAIARTEKTGKGSVTLIGQRPPAGATVRPASP